MQINNANLQVLKNEILAALEQVASRNNVKLSFNGGSFSPENAVLKLQIANVTQDGTVQTVEAQDFKRYAFRHGLKLEALGNGFTYQGHLYTIVGYKPKSRRFPVVATREDGKSFKFPVDTIKRSNPALVDNDDASIAAEINAEVNAVNL